MTNWIKCAERLPEEDAEVFVYAEPGFTYLASRDGNGWLRHMGIGTFPLGEKRIVTHWQPLPDPPKEEE